MRRVFDFLLPTEPGVAVRRFFVTSIVWASVAVTFGLIGGIQMVAPDWLPAHPLLSFGRIRPTHVNLVIFGFLLSAFFGGLLFVVPKVCRTELPSQRLANFSVWFWNAVIVAITYTLPQGQTQGREYAEQLWIIDIGILAAVALLSVLVFWTIARRQEKLLYVSAWYIGGGLLWTFFVIGTGNVVWEPPTGSWEGINDQILMWFYGHNVVGLVITPQAIGMAYYVIPRETRGPLYSHTLSLLAFWALIVMYTHTGTHHLLQAPVAQWLKVISVVGSVALLIPVLAFLINIWFTVRGRLGRVYHSPGAKFAFAGTVWYLVVCLQGPFQSLPVVQRVTHFTQWTIGHAHIALLGFAGFIAVGAMYYVLPHVTKRGSLYSKRLADAHFWLLLVGLTGIFASLTVAGLIQGEAWRSGEVIYRVLPQISVYLVIRGMSGMAVVAGMLVGVYNVAMTVYAREPKAAAEKGEIEPSGEEVTA